jgi:hypothetical protein
MWSKILKTSTRGLQQRGGHSAWGLRKQPVPPTQQAFYYNRFFGTVKVCWQQGMGRYIAWSTSLRKARPPKSAARELGKYNLDFLEIQRFRYMVRMDQRPNILSRQGKF